LIGCNIGEGIGAAIGFTLGWDMISTLVLAVGLAFAIGYAFTIIPMLKTMPLRQAARVTVVGDTASIAAMEITENSLVFIIPGFMHAALTDALFWLSLGIIGSMMPNSTTSGSNSSMRIMQSGSNYLEAGWQVQHPNSATVLVQLDGDNPEGGYIMVIVVPFLHR
jgi:hypothetical protein